jgi:hypothetical protein
MIELRMQDGMEDGAVINLDDVFAATQVEAKEKAKILMNDVTGKRAKRRHRNKDPKMPEGVELVMEDEVDDFLSTLLPEEEEDWNEGATILIGRTQFFLGDMREYIGMPASNPMDLKDQVMSTGGSSGAARRKGAVHRTGSRWLKGDYGSKGDDGV